MTKNENRTLRLAVQWLMSDDEDGFQKALCALAKMAGIALPGQMIWAAAKSVPFTEVAKGPNRSFLADRANLQKETK